MLSFTAFIVFGFIAATITVAAANDWKLPVDRILPVDWRLSADWRLPDDRRTPTDHRLPTDRSIPAFTFLQNIFNENQAEINSLQSDIYYEVVNNTFEDLSFEVTAVYADMESLIVIIDVTSESPVFNETHENRASIGGLLRYASLKGDWPEFRFTLINYYVIDENKLMGVISFHLPVAAVSEGAEYSLHFGGNRGIDTYGHGPSYGTLHFPIPGGNADVKFTVDTLNTESLIHLYPDAIIRRTDAIIKEVVVTPFYLKVYFDGEINDLFTSENSLFWNQSYIHMIDGTRRNVVSESPQDSGTQNETINEEFRLFYLRTFCNKNLIDLEKVSAVVFMGERIPVR
jgi:hypothetical protein